MIVTSPDEEVKSVDRSIEFQISVDSQEQIQVEREIIVIAHSGDGIGVIEHPPVTIQSVPSLLEKNIGSYQQLELVVLAISPRIQFQGAWGLSGSKSNM